MGIFDVPAGALIKAVAADLRKQGVKQPEWTVFVKSGPHKERAPDSPEWFFERMASILYRIYKKGPLGTESLRSYYGGKKRRGVKKPHFKKAGGKIVRTCLQILEKQGFIKKAKKGREITGKGQAFLNQKAKDALILIKQEKPVKKEEKKEEKTEEEKKVAEELRKQEQAVKEKEKAKEEEKKREEKKKEKKKEEAEQ